MSKSTKSLSYLTSSLSISSRSSTPSSVSTTSAHVIRSIGRGRGTSVIVRHHSRRVTSSLSASSAPEERTTRRDEQRLLASRNSYGPSGRTGSPSRAGTPGGGGATGGGAAHALPNAHGGVTAFFDPSSPRYFHTNVYSNHQGLVGGISAIVHPTSPPLPPPPKSPPSPTPPPKSNSPSHQSTSSSSNTADGQTITSTSTTTILDPPLSNSHPSSSKSDKPLPILLSSTSSSYPNQKLPAFFGTSLGIARRSNLVFRSGAYGIPKASVGDESRRNQKGKGKEVFVELKRETTEPEHPLSVGIGEDAYFLKSDSMGVADGVGGWSGHAGANPARWSRKLMHHCAAELARYENIEDELFLQYYEIDPVDVLQRAFERSLAECKEEGVIGSSTALLAVLRNDELRLANMGDCCCSIIRGSDYIFRSEEQQHSFNFPVQIGTNSKDTPLKDAQRFTIKVQKDDIVILSSDGLVDNLFDEDILEEVLRFVAHAPPPPTTPSSSNHPPSVSSRYTLNRFSPQVVSEALCHRAKSVYEDQRAVSSPFQQRAMEEGIHFAGGKRDDVTTLIGIVGELEASPDRR